MLGTVQILSRDQSERRNLHLTRIVQIIETGSKGNILYCTYPRATKEIGGDKSIKH